LIIRFSFIYALFRKNPEKTINGTRIGAERAIAAFELGAAADKNEPKLQF
jgi:hypothetical protein